MEVEGAEEGCLQGGAGGGEDPHPDIEEVRGLHAPREGDHHPPLEVGVGDVGQVHGRPLARPDPLHRGAEDLEAAHLALPALGKDRDRLPHGEFPIDAGSRNHGPEPLHREGSVQRKPERPSGGWGRTAAARLEEGVPERR